MFGGMVVGIDTGIVDPDQDQDQDPKATTGRSTKKGIEVEVGATAGIEVTKGAKKVRMRLLRKERLF